MARVYGSMVDTGMIALPIAVATILAVVRLGPEASMQAVAGGCPRRSVPCSPGNSSCSTGSSSSDWPSTTRRRRHLRSAALAIAAGGAATVAWLLWAHGSLGPVVDQFLFRSSVGERSHVGLADAIRTQRFAIHELLGPLQVLRRSLSSWPSAPTGLAGGPAPVGCQRRALLRPALQRCGHPRLLGLLGAASDRPRQRPPRHIYCSRHWTGPRSREPCKLVPGHRAVRRPLRSGRTAHDDARAGGRVLGTDRRRARITPPPPDPAPPLVAHRVPGR